MDAITLSNGLANHFWGIWLAILAAVILYALISQPLRKPSFELNRVNFAKNLTVRDRSSNHAQLIIAFLFALFLAFYIFLMLFKVDFVFTDNHMFTEDVLQGKTYRTPIWPSLGRFFPLGHQEWNLVSHITKSPIGYHLFPVLELLLVLLLVSLFLKTYPLWFRLLTSFVLLITPSILLPFFGLTFPDRNVIFWLAVFVVSFRQLEKENSFFWFGMILVSVQFTLYSKELASLMFIGFSLTRVVAYLYAEKDLVRAEGSSAFLKRHQIDFAILTLSALYILLYFLINFPYRSLSYATQRNIGSLSASLEYIRSNLFLSVFLITLLARLSYSLVKKRPLDLLADPLAIGGVLWFLMYVKLGMYNVNYSSHLDFIGIIYLAPLMYESLKTKRLKLVPVLVLCLVVSQNFINSYQVIAQRKNFTAGSVRLGEFLRSYENSAGASRSINLFFPYVSQDYILYDLCSYWHYKGVRFAGYPEERRKGGAVFVVKSRLKLPEDRCNPWNQLYRCYHAESANPGDLIVVLPGDDPKAGRFNTLTNEASLLFHYSPLIPWLQNGKMDSYVFKKK